MLHREFEPPDALRDLIKCFWYNRMDADPPRDRLPARIEVLPDGYAEIIFYFGGRCRVAHPDHAQPLASPFMVGLLDRSLVFDIGECMAIIGIRCFPWTVFELLGVAPGCDGAPFDPLLGHPLGRLHTALDACVRAGHVDMALAEIERVLLQTRLGSAIDATVAKAGAAMRGARGTLPVSQVAQAAHATVRTLERKFKHASGRTVKDVSSLIRFEQVRNRLWLDPAASLADLAQALGYADQSHLSREFKRYSGMTPAAFVHKRKKTDPS